jgi:hypothetical protein
MSYGINEEMPSELLKNAVTPFKMWDFIKYCQYFDDTRQIAIFNKSTIYHIPPDC